jgi:microcystin-dependent protein
LLDSEMPIHTHAINASNNDANPDTAIGASPSGQLPAKGGYDDGSNAGVVSFYSTAAPNTLMNPLMASMQGGGLPHNNMMPYLGLTFCIALQGVFPARN